MPSPVDTSVKILSSTMVGAPVLTRAAGSLVALLDAVLVNGFGALTLNSLTVSNGVATASFNGTFPAIPESVVLLSGITGPLAGLNGEQKVTATGTSTVSWATTEASGTAAGTITMKMAPMGWTKPFAGTNVGVYRTADAIGNRFYLRVNDAGTIDTRVVGYEVMTAVSTGTGLFPTSAQLSGGQYWCKSLSTDASPTPWIIIGNSKRFYYLPAPAAGTFSGGTYDAKCLYSFGEFPSLKVTPDAYNTHITGSTAAGSPTNPLPSLNSGSGSTDCVIARLHTNAAGARLAAWASPMGDVAGYTSGQAVVANGPITPSAIGRMMLVQNLLYIDRSTYGPRGSLPELALVPQGVPVALGIAELDIVPGVGAFTGRKLVVLCTHNNPAQNQANDGTHRAMTLMDITGPWQ